MLQTHQWPSTSLTEAKLISQSLIAHTWEDIPHKMKLKNKVIEAPLCTSLQLFVHPFLVQFCWQQDSSEDCFGREQTYEKPHQGDGA